MGKVYKEGDVWDRNGRAVFPPEGGWKQDTMYVVKVAYSYGNPVHYALFYSGFLSDDRQPAGYNQIFHPTYDRGYTIDEAMYFEVVRPLDFQFPREDML